MFVSILFVGSITGWLVGWFNFHTGTGICRWCSPGEGLMNGFQRRASGITMRQIQRLVFQGCVGGGRDLLRWAVSAFIDAILSREYVRESSINDMKAPMVYNVTYLLCLFSLTLSGLLTSLVICLCVTKMNNYCNLCTLAAYFMAICKIKHITIEAVASFQSRRSALFAPLPTCACDPKLSSSLLPS